MKQFTISLVNAIKEWAKEWGRQFIMNLVWLVSCMTIVLGPPATFALYEQNNRLAEGEVPSPRAMLRSYRKQFVVSWLWALSNLVALFVAIVSLNFYLNIGTVWGIWLALLIGVILIFWITMQLYTPPVLLRQEKPSLPLAWRNAFVLLIQSPIPSLLYLFLAVVLIIISFGTVVILLIGGPTLIIAIGCQTVYDRLKVLVDEPGV